MGNFTDDVVLTFPEGDVQVLHTGDAKLDNDFFNATLGIQGTKAIYPALESYQKYGVIPEVKH